MIAMGNRQARDSVCIGHLPEMAHPNTIVLSAGGRVNATHPDSLFVKPLLAE